MDVGIYFHNSFLFTWPNQADIYLFQVNNGHTRINNKDARKILLTLNRFHLFFWYFHYWIWTSKCRQEKYESSSNLLLDHYFKNRNIKLITKTTFSVLINYTLCSKVFALYVLQVVGSLAKELLVFTSIDWWKTLTANFHSRISGDRSDFCH